MKHDNYEYYYYKCQKYARECIDADHIQSKRATFCQMHDQVGGGYEYQLDRVDYAEVLNFESEIQIKILENTCIRRPETEVKVYREKIWKINDEYCDRYEKKWRYENEIKRKNECVKDINYEEENWDSDEEEPAEKRPKLDIPFFVPSNSS